MITHRYLFFAENEQITVYNYYCDNKDFDILTNQGEKTFNIRDNFWNWWIEAASFNSQKDEVDFCFIYDTEYKELVNYKFKTSNDTMWKNGLIERFFKNYTRYNHIKLKNKNTEKNYNKKDEMFSNNSVKVLYTNIDLKEINDKIFKDNDKDENYLAAYFKKKIENENNTLKEIAISSI